MRCSPVFFVLRFRRRLVHVKYMMYRAGELEEEKEKKRKEGKLEGGRTIGGGRERRVEDLKHSRTRPRTIFMGE